jgi:hypothetical protein
MNHQAPIEDLYTAEQVQKFMAAAIRAERELCAQLVENQDTYGDNVGGWFDTLAEKIRARV